MLGDSQEEAGFDSVVGTAVIAVLADRAVRMFPLLGALNIVRTWAALRVMTKDGFPDLRPVGEPLPARLSATCHSGVTLAANHALVLAPLHREGPAAGRRFPHIQRAEVRCSKGCLSASGRRYASLSTDNRTQARAGDTVAAALLAAGFDHAARRRCRVRRARPIA